VAGEVPDVHASKPLREIPLEKVGVSKFPAYVVAEVGPGKCLGLASLVDAFVDLPATTRGLHASRTVKAIVASLEKCCEPLGALVSRICDKLLEGHPYSKRAWASIYANLPYKNQMASFKVSCTSTRSSKELSLRVSLVGITACPSAQAVFSFFEGSKASKAPTHMQRARISASLRVVGSALPTPEEVLDVLDGAFSGRLEAVLSRVDEYEAVARALEKPMFAEDVAREAAWRLASYALPKLSGARGRVVVEVESFESVHPFDLKAVATIVL